MPRSPTRIRPARLLAAALLCVVAMACLLGALAVLPGNVAHWQATGRAPSLLWPLLVVGAAVLPALAAAGLLVYEVARRPRPS
ncbi:MAG: hypothetical protein M3Z02_08460 [Actinomycetota bacterium]|nr:hypothetical protein [Actinomycetota bacterium]